MKLVYITKSIAIKAGLERILVDKMNYLAEFQKYDIYLVTYEQGGHKISYPLNNDIKVIDINKRFFTLKKYNILFRLWKMFHLRRTFRKELSSTLSKIDPDIVISNTYSYNFFDIILNLNYCHIIESHVYLDIILNAGKYHNKFLTFIAQLWDNYLFRCVDKANTIITLTHADEIQWKEKTRTKVVTIPNVVTCFPNDISKSHDLSKKIISVGRLNHQKGFDMLISAWNKIAFKYQGWHIDIYGSGDDEKYLIGLIEQYKLNDLIKIHKPVDNIYDKYKESSIFVLSSRFEGFGLVLVEAMSCGLPVISFDCPHGPSEIINQKTSGILVKAEDINGLADAIEWMILHKEAREEMGRKARITAKKYTKETIMPLWIDLFETIISNKKK